MNLADTFIQSDLQCIQAIHFFYQYVCSLGFWTHNLLRCLHNALPLSHRNSSPTNEYVLKLYSLSGIQDVDEFVSSSEQIWEIVALNQLLTKWILCSEWVPSEWESKQLIKTSQ